MYSKFDAAQEALINVHCVHFGLHQWVNSVDQSPDHPSAHPGLDLSLPRLIPRLFPMVCSKLSKVCSESSRSDKCLGAILSVSLFRVFVAGAQTATINLTRVPLKD